MSKLTECLKCGASSEGFRGLTGSNGERVRGFECSSCHATYFGGCFEGEEQEAGGDES